MKKTLTKHGNSYALIIDKPIMDLLRIQPETPLEISTDGTALIVRPAVDREHRAKVDAAISESTQRYGDAFRRLAE